MRQSGLIQDVEKGRGTASTWMLFWLSVFLMAVALLVGNVRLYEKKEETRLLSAELEQRQAELKALEQEAPRASELRQSAGAIGMKQPDPAEIKILHVRRGDEGA